MTHRGVFRIPRWATLSDSEGALRPFVSQWDPQDEGSGNSPTPHFIEYQNTRASEYQTIKNLTF
jgi:hypothetical protein